jgi:cation diffusion facilitator CzcD-associated flavoprotein CzcO
MKRTTISEGRGLRTGILAVLVMYVNRILDQAHQYSQYWQKQIPSVGYQFTWKIKIWNHYYSYSPEIFEYLKGIYEENDFIKKYVKLKHQIEHAQWDATKGVWKLRIRDIASDTVIDHEAEFFINAGGVLNKWKMPDVPGLKEYKGKLMHSAAYEEGYPLEGKRVAVIGAGSSGVQIVANIQKKGEAEHSDSIPAKTFR